MSYYAEDTLVLYYIYKRTQAVCAKRLYQKQDNSFFKSYISVSSMSSKTKKIKKLKKKKKKKKRNVKSINLKTN